VEERLALLAHELRSPVAALVAIAEALTKHPDALGEERRRRLLRLAVQAGRDVERIVVDFTPAHLRPEPVDAAALVEGTVAATRLRGAEIRLELGDGLPALRGDPVRLRQALANLLDNALAHAPPGTPVVVSVRGRPDGRIELSVADAGEGIAPERQDAIFEAGVRFDDRPGQGVGLAVARAVADAHGGRIEVESVPGAGATFRLVLPPAAGSG
jgi:signal transduction histidine kinase